VKPFRSKKNNEPMAFLTLEDLAGKSVAVTVFPSVFKDYGEQVQKDRVVLLKGRISCRERVMADDEGGRNVELLADEIKLLTPGANGHKNGGAKALNIRLDRSRKDILFLLRRALEQFPGGSPVYLHCPQKVVSRLTVEPSEELRGMVERLVGRQAVWVE
jgi:DNA polymerase III alpha subunit